MRIALVGNWPRPFGGVAVHVAALARSLRARGLDVRVLDIGHGDHEGEGIRPARGPVRYAAALGAAAAEGRLLHVHTSGANAKSWLVALAAGRARRPGAPRGVVTIHSGSAPAFLGGGGGGGGRAGRALAAAACAGFGTVVAVNEEIAAALARAGVDRGRIAVLPAFSPAVLEAREAPPGLATFRAAHAPLLAAALLPTLVYGLDLLLPAFDALRRRLPRAGLVLFGQGSADAALRGPGRLGLGEVPHAAALAILEAADVFVRPTRVDGDAVSVREALALGCRVVASDVGHRPEGCVLFRAGDGAALGASLERAAAARPRPARPANPAGSDPFEALLAIYQAHHGGRGFGLCRDE
jgi:glycosyltransferase involved in cell wall biosynthesis